MLFTIAMAPCFFLSCIKYLNCSSVRLQRLGVTKEVSLGFDKMLQRYNSFTCRTKHLLFSGEISHEMGNM
jgi:hypothetical protein